MPDIGPEHVGTGVLGAVLYGTGHLVYRYFKGRNEKAKTSHEIAEGENAGIVSRYRTLVDDLGKTLKQVQGDVRQLQKQHRECVEQHQECEREQNELRSRINELERRQGEYP
jgi:chromosome segregation ATPase